MTDDAQKEKNRKLLDETVAKTEGKIRVLTNYSQRSKNPVWKSWGFALIGDAAYMTENNQINASKVQIPGFQALLDQLNVIRDKTPDIDVGHATNADGSFDFESVKGAVARAFRQDKGLRDELKARKKTAKKKNDAITFGPTDESNLDQALAGVGAKRRVLENHGAKKKNSFIKTFGFALIGDPSYMQENIAIDNAKIQAKNVAALQAKLQALKAKAPPGIYVGYEKNADGTMDYESIKGAVAKIQKNNPEWFKVQEGPSTPEKKSAGSPPVASVAAGAAVAASLLAGAGQAGAAVDQRAEAERAAPDSGVAEVATVKNTHSTAGNLKVEQAAAATSGQAVVTQGVPVSPVVNKRKLPRPK